MISVTLVCQTLPFWSLVVTSLASEKCPTVITFNAGLTPHVANLEARKKAIPQALLNEDVDVLCLQEYWNEEDIKSLLGELESTYPYHYSPIHYRVGKLKKPMGWWKGITDELVADSSCNRGDILYFKTKVLKCAAQEGCMTEIKKSISQGTECIATKCSSVLRSYAIDPDCISCITILSDFPKDMFSACHRLVGADNRFNTAGLVLLSKKPLSNVEYKSFFPRAKMIIPRGYIKADVQDIGQVVCTHMTSVFPHYYEYHLRFGNYSQQLKAEVNVLNKAFGTSDHILMGDLNMGPGADRADGSPNSDDVVQEENANFELLLSHGYKKSPYVEQDGKCTVCASNSLRTQSPYSNVIDHVLLMGNIYPKTKATRVLDQSTSFKLSDHYGVKAELCST